MNLRSCYNRALSSLSSASLSTKLSASPVRRVVFLGLCTTLAASVADATTAHLHRFSRHSHLVLRHGVSAHAIATTPNASAGSASGLLLAPASNLDAVLNPETSVATVAAAAGQPAFAPRYELRLHHLHTGEDIDIVYRIGNEYIPSAIARLNYFLRDHRTMDVSHYDPREFDLLHTLLATLNRPNEVIDIVCGYRTPWSNNFLRTRSAVTGVAKNSQHMQAKAIDIRVPGVSTSRLRDAALSLRGGGVGYYPVSQFVHVDVGPVRQWSFGGRGE